MKVTYRVVHQLRDGEIKRVTVAETWNQAMTIAEGSRYIGTWINDTTKLLRYGLGKMIIETVEHEMAINKREVHEQDGKAICMLEVINSSEYGWIALSDDLIIIHDKDTGGVLQSFVSFADMADKLDKKLAFECMEHYEAFVSEFNLEAVL